MNSRARFSLRRFNTDISLQHVIVTAATAMVLALTLTTPSSAQKAWQRPYHQWSIDDTEKVLTDSPWVQTLQKGGVSSMPFPNMGARTMGGVTLRLRSGLPVRQAIVRLRQIKANYDRMSPEEKATFDERQRISLECPGCKNNYIVALYPPPSRLKEISLDILKKYIQLRNDRGESRPLVHIEIPKTASDEAILFFSRFNEKGEPLLTPASKKFSISFDPDVFRNDAMGIVRFEFDVSKLILNGEVAF